MPASRRLRPGGPAPSPALPRPRIRQLHPWGPARREAAVPWQQAERTGHGGREATPGRPSLESSQGKVPVPCVSQGPEAGRGREPLEGVATPHPPGHHDTLDVGGFASPAGNGDRGKGAGAGVRAGRTGPLSGPQPGLATPQLLLSIRCSRDQPGTGLLPPAAPPRPFRLWPAWPERGPAGPRAPLLARGRFRSAERQAAVAGRQATPDPPWKPGLPLRLPGLGDPAPRTCRPAPAAPPPSPPLPPAPQPSPRLSCSLHASPSRHRSLPRVSQISVLRAGPRHLSLFPGLFLSLGLWVRHSPKSSVLCPVPAAVRGHGGGRHPWAGGRQRSRGYEIPRDVRARRARRTAGTEPRLQETPPPPTPRLPAAWMELCADIT